MRTNKTDGYRRARKLHARRKFVHKYLDKRPDYLIGVVTGFYTTLAMVLTMGSWLGEYALPYKLGNIGATPVILWGLVHFGAMVALMVIGFYSLPTILWRLQWASRKNRARYPAWVTEVERDEARNRVE